MATAKNQPKTRMPSKKKSQRLLPKHRLFTVIAGPAKEAVRDPLLREWTGVARNALQHLLTAASMESRFELSHQWVDKHRHIHVDCTSKVLHASGLFDSNQGSEVSPSEAGDRLMRQARAELVQLIKMKQGVALEDLVNAAARVRIAPSELHKHLGQMVKLSLGGRMEVQTHRGDYTLMLRIDGMDVADEEIEIEGEIFRSGKDHVLMRPDKAHRRLHDWLRACEKVRFAEAVGLKRQMTKLYRRGVQEGAAVQIVAKRYYEGARKRRMGLFVDKPWTVLQSKAKKA